MVDFNRGIAGPYGTAAGRVDQAAFDEGLRAYMLGVYNYMATALAVTGFAALGTFMLAVDRSGATWALTGLGEALYTSPLRWVVMLAPLGFVFFLSARIHRMAPATAQLSFWAFAALMGISLSSIFLVFTGASITRVFFITAAAFGGLSLWGYTTKKDLSGWGSFLIMGLFGIIIASLVNIFIASSALQFAVSVIGVLVFAGLTAFDTQRLKNEYVAGMDETVAQQTSIMGALSLYLNFINMFMLRLQFFGQQRE